jgi:hypothetical protein
MVTGGTVVTPLVIYDYNIGGVSQLAALLPSKRGLRDGALDALGE